MDYEEKTVQYRRLVNDVLNCSLLSDCNKSKSANSVKLEKCPFCNEVNLWSYWQGGINNLNADILLVGQDWGGYRSDDCKELIQLIKSHRFDEERSFDYPHEKSKTDSALCKLFNTLGDEYNVSGRNNRKVFFTNFVLCYRQSSYRISGGFIQRWANNCSQYFTRLVEIIEPKVIICLGKSVFNNVLKAGNQKQLHCNYNTIITKGSHSVTFGKVTCKVFPMAHCGMFGTNNRNKGTDFKGLDLQVQDWKKLKDVL